MTDANATPIAAGGLWPKMREPMSIGVNIPTAERMVYPGTPQYADMLAMSRSAAGAGFETLWFDDHFSFTPKDDDLQGAWDVWTLMAAIAATVPDVCLGPMVACTAYRNPGVIAKMTEMIQDISQDRFILGLGAGWNKPEYDQFGIPMEPRVSRFEEALQIIHGLLAHGEADVQGTYYQANKAVNRPRARNGHTTPILIGSTGDRMLKSLVEYADAWNGGGTPQEVQAKMAKVDAACATIGRDPATVVRTAGVTLPEIGADGVDAAVVRLREYEAIGIQHVILRIEPSTPEAISAFAPVVEAVYSGS